MKERPMLFSAPMVRAILDGRKTQTRRIMKVAPVKDSIWAGGYKILSKTVAVAISVFNGSNGNPLTGDPTPCPYGKPGDRLWVRETHAMVFEADIPKGRPRGPVGTMGSPARPDWKSRYVYRADGEMPNVQWHHVGDSQPVRWTPSIHMRRLASRIQLEIVSVRVERLQDISKQDAVAEGIEPIPQVGPMRAFGYKCYHGGIGHFDPYASFCSLWESINGEQSWESNPWVWVIEFKPLQPTPGGKQ